MKKFSLFLFFVILITKVVSGKDFIVGMNGIDEKQKQYKSEILQFEKANKDFFKILKKKDNLKSLNAIRLGSNYFVLKTCAKINKNEKYGLLTAEGKTLIPIEFDDIYFFPCNQNDTVRVDGVLGYGLPVPQYYTFSVPVSRYKSRFIGKKGTQLYLMDEEGRTLYFTESKEFAWIPGCFLFSNEKIEPYVYSFVFGYKGLFTLANNDGRVVSDSICEIKWQGTSSKLFSYNPDHLYFLKTYPNQFKGHGIYSLAQNNLVVPPVFYTLSEYKTKESDWVIRGNQKRYDGSTEKTINLDSVYSLPQYVNDGECFIEVGDYNRAIDFYNSMDSLSSDDIFRRGLARKMLLEKEFSDMPNFDVFIKKGVGTDSQNEKWNSSYKDIESKLEESYYENLIDSANQDLRNYLILDIRFQEQALNLLQNKIYKTIEDIDKVRQQYYAAVESIKRYNYYHSFEYQLKKSLTNSLSNITDNYIDKAFNSNNGRSNSSSSNQKTVTGNSAASNSTHTSSQSNSETRSSGLSPNVEARIRQIERNIEQEQEYLKNAQTRYEKDPSATGKALIESHKRAIQGYYKQIDDLKK